MKVLLCPIGTSGDIRPIVAFGHHLKARGHDIAFCSSIDWIHISEELKCSFYPVNIDFSALTDLNTFFMGRPLAATFRFSRNMRIVVEAQEKALHEIVGQFDVVVGSGLSFAAFNACEYHNVPYRHIILSPNLLPSDSYPPVVIARQIKNRRINRILWRMYSVLLNTAMRPMSQVQRKIYGMNPVVDFFDYFKKDLILSYDKAIAPISDEISDISKIPFLHYSDRSELSSDLTKFINAGDMPVYIGFGSMPQPKDSKLFRQLLRIITELKLRAVVLVNRFHLDPVVLGDNVLLIGSQPHDKLFPHMRLIIHHGGAGTTYSAVKAGVPQIIMPHLLDQYYWGRRMYELGVGPESTAIRSIRYDKLNKIIYNSINDARYKERSLQVANALRNDDADPCVELEILLNKVIACGCHY